MFQLKFKSLLSIFFLLQFIFPMFRFRCSFTTIWNSNILDLISPTVFGHFIILKERFFIPWLTPFIINIWIKIYWSDIEFAKPSPSLFHTFLKSDFFVFAFKFIKTLLFLLSCKCKLSCLKASLKKLRFFDYRFHYVGLGFWIVTKDRFPCSCILIELLKRSVA